MSGFNRYPGYYMKNDEAMDYFNERMENDIDEETNIVTKNPIQQSEVIVSESVGKAVELVSLITKNLLLHPFVVLRRQCQVHNNSRKYHIVSVTLIPVILNINKHQGLTALWKGVGSTLLVRGMAMGVEDLISKITPWPNVSLAIMTPFYVESLVETVQSEIASERPGIFDVFKEGVVRLFYWGGGSRGRLLPIWVLVLPTVTLGLARHIFSMMIEGGVFNWMRARDKRRRQQTGAFAKNFDKIAIQETKLNASLAGMIAADAIFYPFETILHRLHLQGTRTIIDNLDTGRSVLPILTNYHGPIDCYESCIHTEGPLGLYKGFGALLLQYVAHVAVIRLTRFLLNEFRDLLQKRDSPQKGTQSSGVGAINATSVDAQAPDAAYYYRQCND